MNGIYFTDLEVVPQEREFGKLPKEQQEFYIKKAQKNNPADEPTLTPDEHYSKNAGLSAEFGKIISASIGVLTATKNNPQPMFYIKTFTSRHEKEVLKGYSDALVEAKTLCGHNAIEFDGPIAMRRYLANGMPIPLVLDNMNRKPWDIPIIDTMKMYSGSAWNYKISQDHLAYLLGVPTSKGELDGSKIAEYYYSMFDGVTDTELPFEKEKEVLGKIGAYNASDVICNARIYAKMKGFKDIKDVDIYHIPT